MTQTFSNKPLFFKKIFITTLLGISSGMPYFVFYQTLPAFFSDYGLKLSTIGIFSLLSLPYTLKFLWAPLLDRFALPFLGKRRSWMFLCQFFLILCIALIGLFNPQKELWFIVVLTLVLTTLSATQDIVIDAYRRELLNDDELGAGNAWFINAYRFSSLIPGSLALILADMIAWKYVFPIVALFMLIGLITTLFIQELSQNKPMKGHFIHTIIDPLTDFITHNGLKNALLFALFLVLYKLGDSMATALSTPFYLHLGFSKTVLGSVVKVAALWSSIAGAFIAGFIMRKISLNKSLWVFGVFQMVTILGFAWLSDLNQPSTIDLFIIVSLEYLGVGMGTVAVVSYMFKVSSKKFAASQIALFTAIASIPRTFLNATTGYIIESVGYTEFFLICTACAIPGMLLLFILAPYKK